MADHYRKTVDLLDEVEGIEQEIRSLYGNGIEPRKDVAADLHRRHRSALKRAEIHAQLALVQASFEKSVGL